MATEKSIQLLTEEFLMDLYFTCLKNEYVLGIVCEHIKSEHLPDRDFQTLHKAFQKLFRESKSCPPFSLLQQSVARNRGAVELLNDIYETAGVLSTEQCVKQLESYIRQVRFQKMFREAGEMYNKQRIDEAYALVAEFSEWFNAFNLSNKDFVNVISDFDANFRANRAKKADEHLRRPVNSFYIDELDKRNGGRDLRKQFTCFLASTGVGKSHIARWIGKNACQLDGLNVLHIQLEGSRDEVVDAYSASLVGCSAFHFSNGQLSDKELKDILEELKEVSGRLYVRSYSRFGNRVTTNDIYKDIQDFKKITGVSPDVVIIDSIDLVTVPMSFKVSSKDPRFTIIEVARTLKDMATSEDVWMIGTYQSTIEDREKLNDEKFVLSEYNISEAKGLSRPLTHLITLNQTANESKENTMRLNIAKSRFFKKGEPFRIATDYDHELFYDRARTLNLNKV